MPIYAYKCSSCGHARDVLQKISDAPLSQCPACGAATFTKQVTAAGFQLKGSGWYVTDFRDGGKKKDGAGKSDAGTSESGKTESGKSEGATTEAKKDSAKPAEGASAPAPSPAPAPSA